jgi:secondary thiamine-phosphate synthase enzyme
MKVNIMTINVQTRRKRDFIDITDRVKDVVQRSRVKNGLVLIRSMHTTAAVTVNENVDDLVPQDLLDSLEKISPSESSYRHNTYIRFSGVGTDTGAAHVHASLIGSDVILPIKGGSLLLGTFEGILFLEFSGPRERKVLVQVLGE